MPVTRRHALALIGTGLLPAAPAGLVEEWKRIAAETDGTVGVSALHLGSGARASLNGEERFPLASVCKLPEAMHILALTDEGKLGLGTEVEILARDVRPWSSAVAESWPSRKRYAIDDLLARMVAQSDNTAADALLRIAGGPEPVTARLRRWGVEGIRIDRSEGRCALDAAGIEHVPPENQWTPAALLRLFTKTTPAARRAGVTRFLSDRRDTGTPEATVHLLSRAFRGELLKNGTTARLAAILESTTTGPNRLKGLLPAGTVVAHKTGTGSSAGRWNSCTNDVGVITLPRGAGQIAIAVYLKASTRTLERRERVIAGLARVAYDAFAQ